MSVTILCPDHREYQAIHAPRGKCPTCWKLYDLVSVGGGAGIVVERALMCVGKGCAKFATPGSNYCRPCWQDVLDRAFPRRTERKPPRRRRSPRRD